MREFKFTKDVETGSLISVHIGRINIGDHVGRLYFCPDGNVRLYVEASAMTDGSIVALADNEGFIGLAKKMRETRRIMSEDRRNMEDLGDE